MKLEKVLPGWYKILNDQGEVIGNVEKTYDFWSGDVMIGGKKQRAGIAENSRKAFVAEFEKKYGYLFVDFEAVRQQEKLEEKEMDSLTTEILNHVGSTIRTVYGPSLVVGIVEENGEKFIHLKEFGDEDYYVKLNREQWEGLAN
jgi:hypothetical protein